VYKSINRIKNIFFRQELEFRAKLFNVLAITGTIISLVIAMLGIFTRAAPVNWISCIASAFFAVALLWYSARTARYQFCYLVTIFVVFIVLFPVMFFSAGGYHSGMPSFFVFAAVFTVFMLDGRRALVMAAVETAVYAGLCVAAYRRPSLVHFFGTELHLLVDTMVGFIAVSAALTITMFLHFRMYNHYQRELFEAREEALRLSKIKSNFLSNMSHEIRTPINIILGMNEMALRENKDSETAAYSRAIESAGKTLLSLVNNVLDMSRIESGRMELSEETYKTADLVRELYIMEKETAARKGLSFTVEADETLPSKLYGDYNRIKQIVLNFLSNAFKYTEQGSVTLRAGYRKKETGDHDVRLFIAVADTGIGIREEQKGELFEVFSRLDLAKHRDIEGSGLGLAIAKELAGLMGGSITVESSPDRGSVFTVELSQTIVSGDPMGAWYTGGEETGNEAAGFTAPGACILAVDDNLENLEVIRLLLKRMEISVDTAAGGSLCLEMVKRKRYNAILMDYMMPDMDGVETFRRLRSEIPKFNTPVLALTAHALAGTGKQFLDEGFADYLTKPVLPEDLEKAVFAVLPEDMVQKKAAKKHEQEEPKTKTLPLPELTAIMAEHGVCFEKGLDYFSRSPGEYRKAAVTFLENYPKRKEEIKKLIGRPGPYPGACSGKFTATGNVEKQFSDRGMDQAGIINFLSTEDTQELAPGFFIEKRDSEALKFRVHSLKSNAKTIGAGALGEIAAFLERYCISGKGTFIEKAADLLFQEWEEAVKGLELFCDETETAEDEADGRDKGEVLNTLLEHVRKMQFVAAKKEIKALLNRAEETEKPLFNALEERIRELEYGEAEKLIAGYLKGQDGKPET
jgi:signal transduction histidine kinase/CheY-like chemotaxis protein/HPt (histidine-containing phosphotransfer) domain-containing protein